MGHIGNQICLHSFVFHAGFYRFMDSLSDIVHCVRQLFSRAMKFVCVYLKLHFSVTNFFNRFYYFYLLHIPPKQIHAHSHIQYHHNN